MLERSSLAERSVIGVYRERENREMRWLILDRMVLYNYSIFAIIKTCLCQIIADPPRIAERSQFDGPPPGLPACPVEAMGEGRRSAN